MVKLQDFARECGVTDRQIQRLLKKYAAELDGLYERKGQNGTWLSDDACQLLRSKMKQQPIVLGDSEIYRKNAELEQEVKDLTTELKEAYKEQAQLYQQIGELNGVQARLEAAETERLALTEARDEYKAMVAEKIEEAARARSDVEQLRAELEAAKERERLLKSRGLLARVFRKGE